MQSPFFQELVTAASSFSFTPSGNHIATRDYMRGYIWDARRPEQHLRRFDVHEQLWDNLMEVYENESIFDRLGCAISPDGQHVALGSYAELCVFNLQSETFTTLRSCGSPVAVNVRICAALQGLCLPQRVSVSRVRTMLALLRCCTAALLLLWRWCCRAFCLLDPASNVATLPRFAWPHMHARGACAV